MEIAVRDKKISIFGNDRANVPVVYLNTVHGEGGAVWEACQKADCPPFILVAVEGLSWNHDMSPWAIPPLSSGDTPCTGGADEYIGLLTKEIAPAAASRIFGEPPYLALAGLFALYASYQTDLFTRIASVSGSLWFPDFPEYVLSHERKASVSHLYLSLGDREAKTRNPYLKTVQDNTEKISAYFKKQGLHTKKYIEKSTKSSFDGRSGGVLYLEPLFVNIFAAKNRSRESSNSSLFMDFSS